MGERGCSSLTANESDRVVDRPTGIEKATPEERANRSAETSSNISKSTQWFITVVAPCLDLTIDRTTRRPAAPTDLHGGTEAARRHEERGNTRDRERCSSARDLRMVESEGLMPVIMADHSARFREPQGGEPHRARRCPSSRARSRPATTDAQSGPAPAGGRQRSPQHRGPAPSGRAQLPARNTTRAETGQSSSPEPRHTSSRNAREHQDASSRESTGNLIIRPAKPVQQQSWLHAKQPANHLRPKSCP